VQPLTTLAAPGITSLFTLPEGDFEVVLRQPGTETVLAGPLPIRVDAGGIYALLAIDGAGEEAVEIVLLEDFAEP
jgi:hypothetical protein